MRVPSGDHEGGPSPPTSASLVSADPSAAMTKSSLLESPDCLMNAIRVLSGDQAGVSSHTKSWLLVRSVGLDPSASTTATLLPAPKSGSPKRMKAILSPFGDQAGEAAFGVWL